jgi:hypothetical protein
VTRTDNDLLRRRIYSAARQKATTTIRNLHPQEFDAEVLRAAGRRPNLARKQQWAEAGRNLARRFPEEFTFYRTLFQAQGELEAGYEPAPRGGHATGIHAKPRPE